MTAGRHAPRARGGLTDFVAHALVCECARRRFAEQDDAPLAALRELEALVVDLVRQLPRRREDHHADTLSRVALRRRRRGPQQRKRRQEIG